VDVEIRYFAAAREATGLSAERLALDEGATVGEVVERLAARHPALRPALPSLRFALDEAFVESGAGVPAGATLALIPPVGGG
jgi:molybdopterin converting factor subunit 1